MSNATVAVNATTVITAMAGALIVVASVYDSSYCVSGITCDSQTHFSTTTAEGKPAYIATRFVLNTRQVVPPANT